MKQSAILLLAVSLIAAPVWARIDDPAYHHLDEIYQRIFALQDSFPQFVRVDSIGCSQQEKRPVYAVWIADDVTAYNANNPAVVYIGQVHAEEVLGVEFMMWLLDKMVSNQANNWRRRVNTYIIPTANPEGLNVVYSIDYKYRKNKRDNIGDGLFRYVWDWGGDTSGVDINRNFPVFWIHGDGFLVSAGNEFYDYYRGPAPVSESETKALMAFFEQVRPLFAITLHSSRTGNISEKIIYPWGFGQETKLPRDYRAFDEYALQVARRCKKLGSGDPYPAERILYAKGDSEISYYILYGAFALRAEIGQEGESMQPDSAGIQRVIQDIALGITYPLNVVAGVPNDEFGSITRSRLAIFATDAVTGNPVGGAHVKIDSLSNQLIPYRTTHPLYGSCFWLVNNSFIDTLTVSKFGYLPFHRRVFGGTDPSRIRVQLQRANWFNVQILIENTNGSPIETPVQLTIEHPDSVWSQAVVGGTVNLNLPESPYTFIFYQDDQYVPRIVQAQVSSDATWHIALASAKVLLRDSFDQSDVVFTSDNKLNLNGMDSLRRWELATDFYRSAPRCLTDSRLDKTIRGEDCWAAPYNMLDRSFDLSQSTAAALVFWLNQALEPDYDSMWVEVSSGGSPGTEPSSWTWTQVSPSFQKLAIFNWEDMDEYSKRAWNANSINLMKFHDWEQVIIPLDSVLGQPTVHFRFHLRSDLSETEDGVYIDDVMLLASGEPLPEVSSRLIPPREFSVGEAYPNPFNERFQIRVNIPDAELVQIQLYDLRGRQTAASVQGNFTAGSHLLSLNGQTLPSGIYFLKVEAGGSLALRKVALVR